MLFYDNIKKKKKRNIRIKRWQIPKKSIFKIVKISQQTFLVWIKIWKKGKIESEKNRKNITISWKVFEGYGSRNEATHPIDTK